MTPLGFNNQNAGWSNNPVSSSNILKGGKKIEGKPKETEETNQSIETGSC